MSDRARVLCIGAAHWDRIARASQPVDRGADLPGSVRSRPGGVALNVATALVRRGVPCGLCAALGADAEGAALLAWLRTAGVDTTATIQVEGAVTGTYLAIEDDLGELVAAVASNALVETAANTLLDRLATCADVSEVFVEANLPEQALAAIARLSSQRRWTMVANAVSPAKADRLRVLLDAQCRPTVIMNMAEASALLGCPARRVEDAASALMEAGAGAALITDGARAAALALDGNRRDRSAATRFVGFGDGGR